MKKSSLIFLAFIVLILFNNNIYSQWQSVENVSGGPVQEIKFKDANTGWYISFVTLIYKTTNGGVNWQCLDMPYVDTLYDMQNLCNIGDTVWVYINGGRLLRSTNGGSNWTVINFGMNDHLGKFSIIRNNLIYALHNSSQMLELISTSNAGLNWSSVCNFNTSGFWDIGPSSNLNFVNDSVGYVKGMWRIYKTTNYGHNWNSVYFDSVNVNSPQFYYMKFIDVNNGFLVKNWDGLYRTSNGGINWQFIMAFPIWCDPREILFDNNLTGYLILGNNSSKNAFYKTSNGGFNWTLQYIDTLDPPVVSVSFFDFDKKGNTIFMAAGGGGAVMKSTNEGLNWTYLTPYFRGTNFNSIGFINSQTGYIGAMDDYLLKTTNAGMNWIVIDTLGTADGNNRMIYQIQFLDENTGWLLTDSGFYKTTNGGNNWAYHFTKIYTPNQFYFVNNNTGWVLNDTNYYATALFKTTNAGEDFIFQNFFNQSASDIKFYDSLYGYITCDNMFGGPQLYRTTNGGLSWEQNNSVSGISTIYIQDRNIAFLGQNEFGGRILKTTNGGENWFNILNINFGIFSIQFANINIGFAVGDKNIYYTTNGGNNWSYSFIGVNTILYKLYRTSENIIFAIGSEGKIYRTSNNGGIIGINPIETHIPTKIKLFQNYPNPFNPVTKIKFDIPVDSRIRGNDRVVLKVYDILGKEIETLVNEKLNPGTYELTFNASQFPSGVYFYRLQAGDYNETKRMILLK
jgi:photosystem II stability/assembly factor-like uncharacterized protein